MGNGSIVQDWLRAGRSKDVPKLQVLRQVVVANGSTVAPAGAASGGHIEGQLGLGASTVIQNQSQAGASRIGRGRCSLDGNGSVSPMSNDNGFQKKKRCATYMFCFS